MVDKMEVIYYEMVKMEDRITKKAEAVLEAESEVKKMLERLELLVVQLEKKCEELKK